MRNPNLFKVPTNAELNFAGALGFKEPLMALAEHEGELVGQRMALLRLVGVLSSILAAEGATIDDFAPLVRRAMELHRENDPEARQ